jgi:CubicO group peptidase (beta-lactamase class C family)
MTETIDRILQAAVDAGDVPNVVAIAADRDGVVYAGAAGRRAAGNDDPVTPDTHFRIASMTKMVATVAALQEMERGTLDLDAPVDAYLPEFADLQVLTGFDGDQPQLRPPESRATVHQLITHTSGVTYWFWNADMVRYEQVTGTPNVLSGAADAFRAPLVADPGTTFEYGTNTDWLGRVVEACSGNPLDAFFEKNIFAPLGMTETGFLMTPEQRANSVPVHVRGDDGSWVATDLDWNQSPDWWAGGHGLYSTPRDYVRFQQMLLGNGAFGDARILSPATVDAAFTNQIGDLNFPPLIRTAEPPTSADVELGPGLKWGYGLLLNTEQQPGMRNAGSGAWAGLFNTHFWVDRTAGITGAIYSQFLPFAEAGAMQLYQDFERALYASR